MCIDPKDLPPPPQRPDLSDCCGGGCIPCIFDYYEEALEKWEQEVAEIKARQQAPGCPHDGPCKESQHLPP